MPVHEGGDQRHVLRGIAEAEMAVHLRRAFEQLFDATTISVVAGSSALTASSNAAPSIFERKRTSRLDDRRPSASTSREGPSTDPPMPICMTPVTAPNTPASVASTSARIRCLL